MVNVYRDFQSTQVSRVPIGQWEDQDVYFAMRQVADLQRFQVGQLKSKLN